MKIFVTVPCIERIYQNEADARDLAHHLQALMEDFRKRSKEGNDLEFLTSILVQALNMLKQISPTPAMFANVLERSITDATRVPARASVQVDQKSDRNVRVVRTTRRRIH